jgi:hypothetical protein
VERTAARFRSLPPIGAHPRKPHPEIPPSPRSTTTTTVGAS